MTAPDPAKKLASLLRRLRTSHGPQTPDTFEAEKAHGHDPQVLHLLAAFLTWEAGASRAAAALKRLLSAVVDYNELRVCLPDELAHIMGERYPRAVERAARIRSALNDLYRREHAVTLAPLENMPKRDTRMFLMSLEGLPPFVAARVVLLCFGGHAFPLDERMHAALIDEEAVPPDLKLEDAGSWLERQFRAGEIAPDYLLLEAWLADRPPPKPPRKPAPVHKAATAEAKPAKAAEPRARTAKRKKSGSP